MLDWLAEEFDEKRRTSYIPSTKALGEMFRSDAKAEDQKVVVGGWELAGSERACDAPWFALELSSAEIPWCAYERGDPFKAISALELLATLLCLVVFGVPGRGAARGTVSLMASGDNRSNGFTLDKFATTKYPLGLVLIELAHQLRVQEVELGITWRPREENIEADALTNLDCAAFDPGKRVAVAWEDLKFWVLDCLVAKANLFHQHLLDLKQRKVVDEGEQLKKGKRKKLKVTDPW